MQRTDGVGLATWPQLADDVKLGRLVMLDVNWQAVTTDYGIVTVRDRTLSPAAEALAGTIREVEAERVNQRAAQTASASAPMHSLQAVRG